CLTLKCDGLLANGYTSFWNDCISSGLRGCMLVELALRGRVQLEACGVRRKSLLARKLEVSWTATHRYLFVFARYNCQNKEEFLFSHLAIYIELAHFFYPLQRLVKKVQDSVLEKWVNDPHRMDKRVLSLILLAHSSDVLENAFAPLQDEQYDLGMKRVHTLLELEPEKESTKPNANELMWAVVAAFTK
ncbi:hypothetical protein XENOCAPTIV_005740, partial [Xenoophorus captivus]